jgi:hypothetical protein
VSADVVIAKPNESRLVKFIFIAAQAFNRNVCLANIMLLFSFMISSVYMSNRHQKLPKRTVLILAFNGVQIIDIAGPAQVLSTANEEGADHQAVPSEQAARRPEGQRPTCPKRHLLDIAVRRTMARSAGELWALYYLLQPVRSLADGWHLGLDHGGPRRNP